MTLQEEYADNLKIALGSKTKALKFIRGIIKRLTSFSHK